MENKLKNKTEILKDKNKDEKESSSEKQNGNKTRNNSNENNIEINTEDFATKINKPLELREFDASIHFKENIINYIKNCSDDVIESSYYCFTCKHSICEKCGVFEHKDHLLIQRDNCINYDKTFFNEISKVIDDSFLIENNKDIIKNKILKMIDSLKEELDKFKNKKLKETDNVFEEIKKNLNELKNNYYEAKLAIEDYYNKNKKFFNVNIIHSSTKDNEDTEKNKEIIMKINVNEENNKLNNKDLENTIFLMNFELMNLCDNKNLQVLDSINEIKYRINLLIKKIEQNNNCFIKELNKYLDLNSCSIKLDDYYLDIKLRTKKYNEFINNFKTILNKILKKTGNLDRLSDLIDIFDSKNKKSKDTLFNQEYFINYNKYNNISKYKNNVENKVKSPKTNKVNAKLVFKKPKNMTKSSKLLTEEKCNDSFLMKNRCLTYNNIINNNKKENNESKRKPNNYLMNYKSIKNSSKKRQGSHDRLIKDNKCSLRKTYSQIYNNYNDIILNNRVIQRFFAYSIYDLFSKFFKVKNDKKNDYSLNNLEKNFEKKTVSFLSHYTERYNKLKEIAKPIIGTNQIQYFDSSINQITKIYVNLSKIDHGYAVFPYGCRHIFIDNILYIVGGADNCGLPTNIVLSYDFKQNILSKLPNLNDEHAYHTIEYLDNYDCIIIMGGENNCCCEIMDLDNKTWIKLPYLNYPRANTNIYYNIFNSDLYSLFGMEGEMTEKNKNSDVIEVLNLNNIINGWKKINYYRNAGLNIKSNYCITLPFSKYKLLVYGCSNARYYEKKLFAFYEMNKKECIKVDKDTLELIKLEENQMKLFDYEISKI